jgi:putative membrane protein
VTSGADFDKEYCDLMVKDHRDVVYMFKKAKDNAKDLLESLGGETLPTLAHYLTLEHHLTTAERMKESA